MRYWSALLAGIAGSVGLVAAPAATGAVAPSD